VDSCSWNILSICAGIGGLDLGLRIAMPDARTVCYVEREAFACEILVARMSDGSLDEAPVWTDLGTFDGKPWRGTVDCIAAGLPCQPYSVAGQRRGDKDERYIWPEFFRIVSEVEPAVVFIENVPGLAAWFRPVGEELCRLGYELEAGIFSAAEVGASHRRERMFVLGHAESGSQAGGTPRWYGRKELGCGCSHVAHAGCSEWWPQEFAGSITDGYDAGRTEAAGGIVEPSCDVADSVIQGLEEWRESELLGQCAAAERDCPDFPPGPEELEKWRQVLEQWPALEPSVRRVADGAASRLDRLRALGNAVVPLQAAYAFEALARRLGRLR
jgi:DNA (cytosine-5)-methyltransferase 1